MLMATDACPDLIDIVSACEAREMSVKDVLWVAADVSDSAVEFNVEARLCFDGVLLRKLTGREGADRPGLRDTDFVDELEGPHRRPKNDVADLLTCCLADSFSCASLYCCSIPCNFSRVTSLVNDTKSLTRSSAECAFRP